MDLGMDDRVTMWLVGDAEKLFPLFVLELFPFAAVLLLLLLLMTMEDGEDWEG